MRQDVIFISERKLMYSIAGQLYDQAPARKPRKADVIMGKVRERIRKDFNNDNEYYSKSIPRLSLYAYIRDLLKEIPEFRELNLSQVEFEAGVSVDDESRAKYAFTSRYDKHDAESWKTDFIDLDAFIDNVHNAILFEEDDQDCFLCKHDRNLPYQKMPVKESHCRNCRNLKVAGKNVYPNKREPDRRPKGEHTLSCKHDCTARSYYICCQECRHLETCEEKCTDHPNSCGMVAERIDKKEWQQIGMFDKKGDQ